MRWDFCLCHDDDVGRVGGGELFQIGQRSCEAVLGRIRAGFRLVKEQARPGDMVVCLGAGTISAWANALPAKLLGQAA